jgi:Holliday junction resolvase
MNEISFSKYFIHLLERNGFTNIREEIKVGDFRVDLTADFNNETYYFEFKIYKNKRMDRNAIEQVNFYSRQITSGKFVLVTNGKMNSEILDNSRITIIDRNALKKIANNYRNLIELINTTPNNV